MPNPLMMLVRHGLTANNKKGTYRGWSDVPLTDEGRGVIHEAASYLKANGYSFPLIMSDDLARSVESRTILKDALGIPTAETDKRLRPLNVGDFTGKSKEEYPLDKYVKNSKLVIPGGESISQFDKREAKFFGDVAAIIEKIKKPILLVVHGSTVSFLHNHFNADGKKVGYEGLVEPGGVLMFNSKGIFPLTKLRGDSERKVLSPPHSADGLFEDTGEYDEVQETHLRDTFVNMFQYSDPWCGNPRTFDPAGDYLCQACNKYEPNACLAVEGDISGDHGSCRHFENLDAGDSELLFAEKISKDMADYGVTVKDGFGCKRCEYATDAKKPDSRGRDMFCKQGAFRVFRNGCCALNDTEGMVSS